MSFWLLWAFWSFTAGRVWLNGALKALSILIVLYLVRKDENSAYKIGWIVLIGLLPLLGGALYLAFGNKAPAKHLRERMQKVEQAHQTELAQPEGQTDALDISSRNLSRYVAKFGPYPAWRDTAAHYFSCGEEMQEHWISIEQPETRHRKQLIRQRQHLTAMRNCFRFQVRAVPENIVIRIWQTRCLRLQEILLETVEKRCMIHFLILFSQQHAREDMQPV